MIYTLLIKFVMFIKSVEFHPVAVKTDISRVHSNFLQDQGVDLVVYSDNYNDNIINDSRTDENGELIKLTDVVCLWLNLIIFL